MTKAASGISTLAARTTCFDLAAPAPLTDGDKPPLTAALDHREYAVEADGDPDADVVELEGQLQEWTLDRDGTTRDDKLLHQTFLKA